MTSGGPVAFRRPSAGTPTGPARCGGRGSFYSLRVILAAGLLILVGLGLFVAGILTGVTVLYWACVAACVVAGVLLIVAWRRMPAKTTGTGGDVAEGATPGTAGKAAAMPSAAPPATPSPEPVPAAPEPADEPAAVTIPHAADGASAGAPDPGVEEVEVTDLLIVVDLKDEVLVVDEH